MDTGGNLLKAKKVSAISSVVKIFADDASKAIIDVVAVVDPLSTAAQKVAPIIELIGQTVNCDLKIVMNPKGKLSELPLKRYFYVRV